jgi:cell division initiation protein
MELTPNDIRNQKFSSSFRGYDRVEVDGFMEEVASALEESKVQSMKLAEEKESLSKRYDDLKSLENTIRNAVVEAQKGAETILSNAKKESELIVSEAKHQRDVAIEEKHRRLAEMEARLEELLFMRRTLFIRLRADIGVTLKLLEAMNPMDEEKKSQPRRDVPENEIDKIVEQFRKESGAFPFEASVREDKENKNE